MKRSLLLSALVVCFCCSKPVPELDYFDSDDWKNDPKGCNNTRSEYITSLEQQRDKLKGLSEGDLVTVLGRPDRTDLSEHHEKFYYYFISCPKADSIGMALIVRFNATGVSKEVVIQ